MNDELQVLKANALDLDTLEGVSAGAWQWPKLNELPQLDLSKLPPINLPAPTINVNVIQVQGNGNTVAGGDLWIFDF